MSDALLVWDQGTLPVWDRGIGPDLTLPTLANSGMATTLSAILWLTTYQEDCQWTVDGGRK